jgi:hypothetical protein
MALAQLGKRLILLLAYLGVGFLVVWLFGGGGHGTFLTVPIVLSWGILPAMIFRHTALLSLIPVYLLLVVYLNSVFAKFAQDRVPWVTATIHGLGIIVCMIIRSFSNDDIGAATEFSAIIISAVLVMAYLQLDWILAGGRTQPLPKGPYWDLGQR